MVRIFGNCSMNLFLKFSFSSLFTINVSHYTHNMGTWNLYNLAVFGTQICVGNNGEENMSGRELKNNFFLKDLSSLVINSSIVHYIILFFSSYFSPQVILTTFFPRRFELQTHPSYTIDDENL